MEFYDECLNSNGGVLLDNLQIIIDLANDTDLLLQQKTLFLLILRASTSEIITSLEEYGLDEILERWFYEARNEKNSDFMLNLLKCFKFVSFSKELLDEVKELTDFNDKRITKEAFELIKQRKVEEEKRARELLKSAVAPEKKYHSTVKKTNIMKRSDGFDDHFEYKVVCKKRPKLSTFEINDFPIIESIPSKKLIKEDTNLTKSKNKSVSWASGENFKTIYYYESCEIEADSSTDKTKESPKSLKLDNYPQMSKHNVTKQDSNGSKVSTIAKSTTEDDSMVVSSSCANESIDSNNNSGDNAENKDEKKLAMAKLFCKTIREHYSNDLQTISCNDIKNILNNCYNNRPDRHTLDLP